MTRRQRRVRRHRGSPGKVIVAVGAVLGGLLLTAIAAGGGWVLSIAAEAPNPDNLKEINKGQNSVIFAGDGSKLGLIDSDEIRTPIPISEIPQSVQDATVAIEDERFYQHNGIDLQGGLRALVKNFESGEITEGASTITMQLMRNLYIANPERDYERKIKEAKMALDYEKDHTKKQILGKYLNTAPYGTIGGRNAIGIDAAAKVYFSLKPRNLNLPQAALLAGLPQAPSDYNPMQNPAGAKERRNEVLDAMADQNMITEERAAKAKASGLQLDPADNLFDREDPFFFDYVESELIKKYGVNTVRRGGLKVYTTVSPSEQQAGLDALSSNLYAGGPSGALVAIDPQNGEIRAMVSSASYEDNQYNLAAQGKRQPGSTFKVFTLTTAIHEGIDPYTTYYESKPLNINDPTYGPWEVHTYGDSYHGTISVAQATLYSDNSVFAQLALDVGPDKIADMAHEMGIKTKLDGYPAETLGGLTIGVSPLEMAGAYSTLASGGIRHDPTAIEKVVFPDGEVDRPSKAKGVRVLTEAEAYEVTKILHDNITGGTGTAAYTGCGGQAGKTGTTDNQIDAWFVGYQPNLTAAVWYGYPESNDISTGSDGGGVPASIWNSFFVNAAVPCEETPVPAETMDWGDFSGGYTVSPGTQSDYGPDSTDSTSTDGTTGTGTGTAGDGTVGPADAYAPGVGQEPAGVGGGTGGSTGGGGGGTSGGVTPG
ncbi:MAG: transglycosylase domain-containing protein [Thermoleophilales bacterium]|nr:transglycosylase domain-containing protein [Thermoleophilales bacterium]